MPISLLIVYLFHSSVCVYKNYLICLLQLTKFNTENSLFDLSFTSQNEAKTIMTSVLFSYFLLSHGFCTFIQRMSVHVNLSELCVYNAFG